MTQLHKYCHLTLGLYPATSTWQGTDDLVRIGRRVEVQVGRFELAQPAEPALTFIPIQSVPASIGSTPMRRARKRVFTPGNSTWTNT